MTIKAAMREPSGLHHFRHADGVEPPVPEQPAGDIQDPAAVFHHLLAADFHFKILHRPH